jgi:hypothetical protein
MVTELQMRAPGGAPFPLQPDAFSCRVALNFNRPTMGIPSRGALFEKSVNAQGKFPFVFVFCSQLPRWVTLRTVGRLEERNQPRPLDNFDRPGDFDHPTRFGASNGSLLYLMTI